VSINPARFQEMSLIDEGKSLSVALLIMRNLNHFFLLILLNFLLEGRLSYFVDGVSIVDRPDHY
jgi:hypothetical protein